MKNLVEYINESYEYTHNLSKSEQDWVNYNKDKSEVQPKIKNKVQPKSKKELIKIINDSFEKGVYDLNFIDTSKITDMSELFCLGVKLRKFDKSIQKSINISDWDVSNVKDMSYMFHKCTYFNCDLSRWDVSNVKDMSYMFQFCYDLNCDLSGWNVSNVLDMRDMFYGCNKLTIPSWYKE